MLNKLYSFICSYDMLHPGDMVTCAVSGGADSMALLYGMYLLAPKLQITLQAAHFNHQLRGAESDRDETFVRNFCDSWQIPLTVGTKSVTAGEKGLEAAARDARYCFLRNLPGKILTAHTADDNAETVLMHLLRGTSLKGLGGITPINGNVCRPMLQITRKDVLSFLKEYSIPFVEDSTNAEDAFLRNRIRHKVMPLLREENPRLAENMSDMALRLREEEKALNALALKDGVNTNVTVLRQMQPFQRRRVLAVFLENAGVKEPAAAHIALAESLVFSDKPSAYAAFPGNIVVQRNYDALQVADRICAIPLQTLPCPGSVEIPQLNLRITAQPAQEEKLQTNSFTVCPAGPMVVRSRISGDALRLSGGSKSLKKLFIDKKIPASGRMEIPVIADDMGVLGVYSFGANLDRVHGDNKVCITFQVL